MLNSITQNLGFGTSSLTKNSTKSGAIQNLETAFALGITHFDTAPAYGFGHSEGILGGFAKGKRADITITTKFGVSARRIPFNLLPVFNLVRKPLKKALATAVKFTGSSHHHAFSYITEIDVKGLEESLHRSLKKLQTDYIDNFLLHDVSATLANQDEVVEKMMQFKEAGKVRNIGLGGGYDLLSEGDGARAEYSILQFGDQVHKNYSAAVARDAGIHYYRYGLFSVINYAKQFLLENERFNLSAQELCLSYFKQDRNFGTTIFSSSKNENIKGVVEKWLQEPGADARTLQLFANYLIARNVE